jgi:LuxR family maltose regulon positive regulatory protein
MTAYQALFRLREIQGRSEEALDYLTRLEDAWPDMVFCTRSLRVAHNLRTMPEDPETLSEAVQWTQSFSSSLGDNVPPPGMGPFGAAEAYYLAYLVWVRAQISIGNSRIALSYLERQLGLALSQGLTNRVIELSLLEAQARQAEGDNERAWSALDRALSAAEPEGYIRIFDQGTVLNQLLAEAAQRNIHRAFIERLLAVIRIESHTSLSDTHDEAINRYCLDSGEQLSERELEVVRLMACGATNQEIAEKLVITVGTVKSHVNHILRKLDSHNRTEAVARVRGLGLLKI